MNKILFFIILGILCFANKAESQPFKGFMINPYRLDNLKQDVRETSGFGANVFRYFIAYPAPNVVETWDAQTYNGFLQAHIALIDSIIPTVAQQNSVLIIDLHTPPCGFSGSTHRIFSDLYCLGQFYGAWDTISKHYAWNRYILGYDVLNEPATKNYSYWNSIIKTVIGIIRRNDPDRMVVVESPYGNPLLMSKLEPYLPNTWYSSHIYCNKNSTSTKLLNKVISFKKKYNATIYLGEVGCETYKSSAAKFMDKLLTKAHKNNINWSYHAWREAGMWNPEGTPMMGVLYKHLAQ